MKIEQLKKGDYFTLLKGKDIKVYDGYNRFTKMYSYYSAKDVGHWGEKKKGILVTTDFEY